MSRNARCLVWVALLSMLWRKGFGIWRSEGLCFRYSLVGQLRLASIRAHSSRSKIMDYMPVAWLCLQILRHSHHALEQQSICTLNFEEIFEYDVRLEDEVTQLQDSSLSSILSHNTHYTYFAKRLVGHKDE
jgi:hypothetical protein